MRASALVALLVACGAGQSMPTCAELGCAIAASGEPDDWTPCTSSECWCSVPTGLYGPIEWLACSRVPCASVEPLCPTARHAEYGEYFIDGVPGRTCFCSPD